MRKIDIGSVHIFKTGTNPYDRKIPENHIIGDKRVKQLRQFKEGKLPPEFSAWDAGNLEIITDPAKVDWTGLRD